MFHGVIQKIVVAQFFETRCRSELSASPVWNATPIQCMAVQWFDFQQSATTSVLPPRESIYSVQ